MVNRQENALESWTLLEPQPEVILIADEPGVAGFAVEMGCEHIDDVQYVVDRPLLPDVYAKAVERASADVLCYINADCILMQDFVEAVRLVASTFERFMMIGRKWDLEAGERMAFRAGWQDRIRARTKREGQYHGRSAVDYHVFSLFHPIGVDMPQFVIGGTGWDTWLVDDTLTRGYDVVDATDAALVVHQHIHGKRSGIACNHNRAVWKASMKAQGRTANDLHGKTTHAQWKIEDGEIVENPQGWKAKSWLSRSLGDRHPRSPRADGGTARSLKGLT